MTRAIRVHQTGGPEVLTVEEVAVGPPGPDEVLLRHTAIGVNFIDIYHRRGLYRLDRPFIPGTEGVGIVEAVGGRVGWLKVGDRVAYANAIGAYCERRLIAVDRVAIVPAEIDDTVAAAGFLKGLTARYLIRQTYRVTAETVLLFHAAAGGVGLIACQWAAALGATVIGTVGSAEKAVVAKANGCAHVIDYRSEDFVGRVRQITDGAGVDVVYDSIGKDTFPASLDALKPRGMWVSFGQSSGPVPDFSPLVLMQKGSLYCTRPTIAHYAGDRAALAEAATALFDVIAAGTVRVRINQTFPLAEAEAAHRAVEGRRTTGSTVLIP